MLGIGAASLEGLLVKGEAYGSTPPLLIMNDGLIWLLVLGLVGEDRESLRRDSGKRAEIRSLASLILDGLKGALEVVSRDVEELIGGEMAG